MERGLIWLPLLLLFFGLTYSGWHEYKKVEAYQNWAKNFDKSKYDIYSVLGIKNGELTWGKPTRKEPINLETFLLKDVESINLSIDEKIVDLNNLPTRGKPILEFIFLGDRSSRKIAFTDINLAHQWLNYLRQQIK